MHYEEKLIDGVWYWRSTPDGEWSVKKMQMSKADEEKMTNNNDIQAALDALEKLGNAAYGSERCMAASTVMGLSDIIKRALAQQQPDAELLEALKYAHSQMQPFCDDTIVKQTIARAEQKGGV